MTKNKLQPVLYILMRTDIISMNPGKAMAQACHAANQCVNTINTKLKKHVLKDMLEIWEGESGRGFGTTIVLAGGTMQDIKDILRNIDKNGLGLAQEIGSVAIGTVLDDTYPLKDGDFLHLIPLETCGYIFCDKSNKVARQYLDILSLHP